MHYQFTNERGNAFLTLKPTNDVERALVGVLGHGKVFLHQPDDDSLVIGFETLFSDDAEPVPSKITLATCDKCDGQMWAIEFNGVTYTAKHSYDCKSEPPQPAPTPAAPAPGRGWRLLEIGETIPPDSQIHISGAEWRPSVRVGNKVYLRDVRTPIYHNPANLETAGEGYRFLLKGEGRTGDEQYYGRMGIWERSCEDITNPLRNFTYRTKKPLPTT